MSPPPCGPDVIHPSREESIISITAINAQNQFKGEDYLRPILQHRAALLYERSFQHLIGTWSGAHNRLVFRDAERRHTVIVNRAAAFDLDGLWLGNRRWSDGSRFDWYRRAVTGKQRHGRMTFYL